MFHKTAILLSILNYYYKLDKKIIKNYKIYVDLNWNNCYHLVVGEFVECWRRKERF